MNEAREKLLKECLKKLDMLKAKYCIIDEDGNKHGELEIQEKKETVRHNYKELGYMDIVRAMEPGDKYTFTESMEWGDDRMKRENYRSSISSCGNKAFGGDAFTTTVNADKSITATRKSVDSQGKLI